MVDESNLYGEGAAAAEGEVGRVCFVSIVKKANQAWTVQSRQKSLKRSAASSV
jgi:hypothetical protein